LGRLSFGAPSKLIIPRDCRRHCSTQFPTTILVHKDGAVAKIPVLTKREAEELKHLLLLETSTVENRFDQLILASLLSAALLSSLLSSRPLSRPLSRLNSLFSRILSCNLVSGSITTLLSICFRFGQSDLLYYKSHLVFPSVNTLARHPAIVRAAAAALGTDDILLWDSSVPFKLPSNGDETTSAPAPMPFPW
jgi:hypothetical protein